MHTCRHIFPIANLHPGVAIAMPTPHKHMCVICTLRPFNLWAIHTIFTYVYGTTLQFYMRGSMQNFACKIAKFAVNFHEMSSEISTRRDMEFLQGMAFP